VKSFVINVINKLIFKDNKYSLLFIYEQEKYGKGEEIKKKHSCLYYGFSRGKRDY